MTHPEAFAPDPLPSLVRARSDSEAVMTEPSSVTQASDSRQFVTDWAFKNEAGLAASADTCSLQT